MPEDTDQAERFIQDLDQDAALQEQFMIASPKSLDGVVDFASNSGYHFSKDELDDAMTNFLGSRIAEQLRANPQ